MSDFIDLGAIDDDGEQSMMEECKRVEERESDREFIDDTECDESVTDYYGFTNVSRSYEDAMEDPLEDFNWNQEPGNYSDESTNTAIDEFNNSENRVDKFKSSLVNPQGGEISLIRYSTACYAL